MAAMAMHARATGLAAQEAAWMMAQQVVDQVQVMEDIGWVLGAAAACQQGIATIVQVTAAQA